jgi:hypothetical protein
MKLQLLENLIQIKLDFLISRLTGLNQKMKVKQQSKKAKRLEQKKRGKNYKEPVHLIKSKPLNKSGQEVNDGEKQELKRLYKQAIVQVHPDKLGIEGRRRCSQNSHRPNHATQWDL